MILETRALDAETFLHFQKNEDGSVIGKLIRVTPLASEDVNGNQQMNGTYIEYRTQPCRSISTAELFVAQLLEELDDSKPVS